ncbi:FkbM family methyltransferase [Candidatus Thioglobus sp.]|nr:FkbM family methyltransferase [Candidatus Thioglobus sp.]
MNFIKKVIRRLYRLYLIYIQKDRFSISVARWFKDKGDKTLRVDYKLNKDSVVFDLGGYKGEFAEIIYDKYKSKIFIFEPVGTFFKILEKKFISNNAVKIFNFGLSDKDETTQISLSDNGSSVHIESDKKEQIKLISITDFIISHNINHIDLFKINIEGGEFEVLPALIKADLIKNIDNLQIQFHNFITDSATKRESIRKELLKTHRLTYDYYFVWENWQKK